jgi:hypothetical protein
MTIGLTSGIPALVVDVESPFAPGSDSRHLARFLSCRFRRTITMRTFVVRPRNRCHFCGSWLSLGIKTLHVRVTSSLGCDRHRTIAHGHGHICYELDIYVIVKKVLLQYLT